MNVSKRFCNANTCKTYLAPTKASYLQTEGDIIDIDGVLLNINQCREDAAAFKANIEEFLSKLTIQIEVLKDPKQIVLYGSKVQTFIEKTRYILSLWSSDITSYIADINLLINNYNRTRSTLKNNYIYSFSDSYKDEKKKLSAANGMANKVNALNKIVTKINDVLIKLKQSLDFSMGIITYNGGRSTFAFYDTFNALLQEIGYDNKNSLIGVIKNAGLKLTKANYTIKLESRQHEIPLVKVVSFENIKLSLDQQEKIMNSFFKKYGSNPTKPDWFIRDINPFKDIMGFLDFSTFIKRINLEALRYSPLSFRLYVASILEQSPIKNTDIYNFYRFPQPSMHKTYVKKVTGYIINTFNFMSYQVNSNAKLGYFIEHFATTAGVRPIPYAREIKSTKNLTDINPNLFNLDLSIDELRKIIDRIDDESVSQLMDLNNNDDDNNNDDGGGDDDGSKNTTIHSKRSRFNSSSEYNNSSHSNKRMKADNNNENKMNDNENKMDDNTNDEALEKLEKLYNEALALKPKVEEFNKETSSHEFTNLDNQLMSIIKQMRDLTLNGFEANNLLYDRIGEATSIRNLLHTNALMSNYNGNSNDDGENDDDDGENDDDDDRPPTPTSQPNDEDDDDGNNNDDDDDGDDGFGYNKNNDGVVEAINNSVETLNIDINNTPPSESDISEYTEVEIPDRIQVDGGGRRSSRTDDDDEDFYENIKYFYKPLLSAPDYALYGKLISWMKDVDIKSIQDWRKIVDIVRLSTTQEIEDAGYRDTLRSELINALGTIDSLKLDRTKNEVFKKMYDLVHLRNRRPEASNNIVFEGIKEDD